MPKPKGDFTITHKQMEAAALYALGLPVREIMERLGVSKSTVRQRLDARDVKDHFVPSLRAILKRSGRTFMDAQESQDYLQGIARRTIERYQAIEKFTPDMLADANGFPLNPKALSKDALLAVKSWKVAKTIKVNGEDKLLWEYQYHESTKAAMEVLGLLGIKLDKKSIAEAKEEQTQDDQPPIAKVDYS